MKLEKSSVYFVGDEVRDIEVGNKAGIKTITVSWWYNTRDNLSKDNPNYLIDSPKELEKIF